MAKRVAGRLVKNLGLAGKPINFRIVRRASLPPGVKEIRNPRSTWRFR